VGIRAENDRGLQHQRTRRRRQRHWQGRGHAEVIANELRLTLYRIDLSVWEPYVGETDKICAGSSTQAAGGGADFCLSDEADALFGKRSEVKHSPDRLPKIEINYLLQRIESLSRPGHFGRTT